MRYIGDGALSGTPIANVEVPSNVEVTRCHCFLNSAKKVMFHNDSHIVAVGQMIRLAGTPISFENRSDVFFEAQLSLGRG